MLCCYLAVDELVDGGDELPAVAEDEEPHDRQGDAGQPEIQSTSDGLGEDGTVLPSMAQLNVGPRFRLPLLLGLAIGARNRSTPNS